MTKQAEVRSVTPEFWAIYRLEPIGLYGRLEAVNVEGWACSQEHALQKVAEWGNEGATDIYSIGRNGDVLDGCACEVCGALAQRVTL